MLKKKFVLEVEATLIQSNRLCIYIYVCVNFFGFLRIVESFFFLLFLRKKGRYIYTYSGYWEAVFGNGNWSKRRLHTSHKQTNDNEVCNSCLSDKYVKYPIENTSPSLAGGC